jgi:hypothetical protein
MTFALTKFKAWGVEIDEPVTKKFMQFAHLSITAAATDVALDIGTDAGAFWTAALANGTYGTSVATPALAALQAIQAKARAYLGFQDGGLACRNVQSGGLKSITSSAGAGGAATEAMVVTGLGLAAADTIIGVTQKTKGANNLPLLGYTTQAANALTCVWSADPGAGAVVQVSVLRAGLVVTDGGYTVTVSNMRPVITMAASNGLTAYEMQLSWELKEAESPIYRIVG